MDINLCLKILNAEQIRKADQFTIKNEPIPSIDLMERASETLVDWFVQHFSKDHPVAIFCGTGNNGGDGLVIARLLNNRNYNVEIHCIGSPASRSRDFKINFDYIQDYITPNIIKDKDAFPQYGKDTVIIDAIFGSGLSRPVQGLYEQLINHLNELPSKNKIAVDLASGLSCEKRFNEGAIMKVSHSVSFQAPKLSQILPQNDSYTGELAIENIGLNEEFIQSLPSDYYYGTPTFISSILKKRKKYAHKGSIGKNLIIAGSLGKMGAAVLSGRACMKAGAGLLTMHVPTCGLNVLQTSTPEAMVTIDEHSDYVTKIENLKSYDAIGVGPGIGTHPETHRVIKSLLNTCEQPIVIDADAINILAKNKDWIASLPKGSILTPHPGEFERLVGKWENDYERLRLQKDFCLAHKVTVVLKGAHTSICDENGTIVFNSTGNPGMATGGSGDVLTGFITAFSGQGYKSFESAILGVYLHGLAGDLYANEYSEETLIASEIINFLPLAFRNVSKNTSIDKS
jgi:NAD(P)H-hydrate epimerase